MGGPITENLLAGSNEVIIPKLNKLAVQENMQDYGYFKIRRVKTDTNSEELNDVDFLLIPPKEWSDRDLSGA